MRPSVEVGELALAFAGISASALRRSGRPLRLLAGPRNVKENERAVQGASSGLPRA